MLRYALLVMTTLRALGAATIALLAVPAASFAAEEKKQIGKDEQVTLAMFVLIIALVVILAIAVALENRKGSKH